MNWTGLGVGIFDGSGVGLDWNGSQWMAVGNGTANTIAMSNDVSARIWTGLGKTVFSSGIQCVKWMMDKWFVGADSNGTNTIASSPDGTTWTYVATNTNLSSSCRSISWNGRETMATGTGANNVNIITSADGVTWTSVSTNQITGGYGVEWNGNKWIAASSGNSVVVSVVADSSGQFGVSPVDNSMTQGYCVGANSGVGANTFNNRVYLNAGERLVVYGPEYYDGSLSADTSISMNMNLPV